MWEFILATSWPRLLVSQCLFSRYFNVVTLLQLMAWSPWCYHSPTSFQWYGFHIIIIIVPSIMSIKIKLLVVASSSYNSPITVCYINTLVPLLSCSVLRVISPQARAMGLVIHLAQILHFWILCNHFDPQPVINVATSLSSLFPELETVCR